MPADGASGLGDFAATWKGARVASSRRAWQGLVVVAFTVSSAVGTLGASSPVWTFGPPADAGTDARTETVITSTLPDPPPLREKDQYLVDLRWVRGDVYLVGMSRSSFPTPQESPRVMGRFALELYEGKTLLERVRFDFPLLGAPDLEGVKLSRKLTTRIGVTFPATSRGTHLDLWDRATDTRWSVPWPPATLPRTEDGGAVEAGKNP